MLPNLITIGLFSLRGFLGEAGLTHVGLSASGQVWAVQQLHEIMKSSSRLTNQQLALECI